jgi:squalene-hopene/tetraprenyl-beta-curcumene cyclase
LLRSGQSLTPFVLDALLSVPESVGARPADAVDRALAFLKKNTNADGQLGLADSIAPDYPNYATGLAVRAIVRANRSGWDRDIAPLVACLRAQQFSEEGGWKREDAPYGAWGMGGARLTAPDAGHVDLAMTRYVLEGLAAAGVAPSDPAIQRALVYLGRCQNPDGGFFFSTVNLDTNKAGDENSHYRSYGTTTADGIISLRACGVPDADPRINRAMQWLRNFHQPDRAPGFAPGPREAWASGLRYYYGAAITRASPGLPVLLPPQRADGSFANSSNLVKEDDPLIATPFALRVLCHDKGG